MKLNFNTTKRLNNPFLLRVLEEAVDTFLGYSEEEAEMIIWELTYAPEKALEKMSFPIGTSKEQATIIRKELANQYRAKHKEWSFGQYFEQHEAGKTSAAEELKNALGNDPYQFDKVMQALLELSYGSEIAIDHALRCLKSRNQKSQFGGVRALHFSFKETEFLFHSANQMAAVLEEMTEEKMNLWYDSSKSYKHVVTKSGLKTSSSEPKEVKETSSDEASTAPIAVTKESDREVSVNIQNEGIKTEKVLLAGSFFASYSNVREHAKWLLQNRQQVNDFFHAYDNMKNNIDVDIDLLLNSPQLVDSLMEIFM